MASVVRETGILSFPNGEKEVARTFEKENGP